MQLELNQPLFAIPSLQNIYAHRTKKFKSNSLISSNFCTTGKEASTSWSVGGLMSFLNTC